MRDKSEEGGERRYHEVVNHEHMAMSVDQLEVRTVQVECDKLLLEVIDREANTNSLQGRYLPISSAE